MDREEIIRGIGGREVLSGFFDIMHGPDGCDFRQDENGKWTWRCYGGMDQRYARAALESLGVEERWMERFLCLCRDLGGHCDCEILLNAMERLEA
jgi:hypothetical protein